MNHLNCSIGVLLGTVMLFSSCKNQEDDQQAGKPQEYPVTTLKEKDTTLSIPYVADLQAYKNVELRARTEGVLEKIYIKEGQYVAKGQLLFKVSDNELRIDLSRTDAAFKSAKADAEVAKVEVERVQTLVDNDVVTKTELDLAKAKHKALLAKVDVTLAEKGAVEKRISYTSITAPFDGIVDRIPFKEGSLVSSESLLTTLSDIKTVYAYFNISENEYFQVSRSNGNEFDLQDIHLMLPDGSTYPYSGTLASAESEIDANTGNIAYKVVFDNPQKILRHGASGKILITRSVPKAVLAPQRAVFEIQDKNYVFVLDKNNVAKMKSIGVSRRIADFYLVTSGLKGGDRIVYEGIQSLRDGQKIVPKNP